MWDKKELFNRTYKIEVEGRPYMVRKFKYGEILTHDNTDGDMKKKTLSMLSELIIEPKLSMEEIAELEVPVGSELSEKIMALCGFGAKSKEAIQGNLTEIPPVNSSLKSQDGSENMSVK
ncbi:MAG: hypothetical protein WCX65_19760 [bacterium]